MSDFEKFWDNDYNVPGPLPFPRDARELTEWCKVAYEAGFRAGLEKAAEIAEQSIGENWACCTNSVLAAVEAIRERIK